MWNTSKRTSTSVMTEAEVRRIVHATVEELRRQGFLRNDSELSYAEVSGLLSDYYKDGETDRELRRILKSLESDPYYKIIPLYYDYGYTMEKLAEVFDVEVSTIYRNKKRLCLSIFSALS